MNEYRLNLEDEQQDASNLLDVLKGSTFQVENRIEEGVVKKLAVTFFLSLHVNFHLITDVAFLTDPPAVLSTDTVEVYDSSDIHDTLNSTYENLVSAIEDFQQRGSGWILDKLVVWYLHLLEFDPLRATSYIPLPTCIQDRKAVINIRNKDEKCFSMVCYCCERLSHSLGYEKEFNLRGISFPMTLKDIPKFERLNNVSISVYGYQEGLEGFVYPLKVSKEVNERHVDLLLIVDDDTNHYCFIKDFGRLVGSQYSNANKKPYFCRFSLRGSSRVYRAQDRSQHRRTDENMEKKLKGPERNCFAFAAQRSEFPDDPIPKFENIQNQVEAPFTVYADFESILKQLSGDRNKYQEHIACSSAYQIVSSVPEIEFEPRLHVGVCAADHFLDTLQEDLNKYIMPLIEKDVDMIWNDEAKEKFESATHCHACKKELYRLVEPIVRDRCHFIGEFRGAAHQHEI